MSKQKIIVEKIYDPREGQNQAFKTLQLRTETERPTSTGSILNALLGNGKNTEIRVAFQSVKAENIDALGIKEGSQLNIPGSRLTVKELTFGEYIKLDSQARLAYRMKRNSSDEAKILVLDDKPVFRSVTLTADTEQDKFVHHTGMVEDGTWDDQEMREYEAEEVAEESPFVGESASVVA